MTHGFAILRELIAAWEVIPPSRVRTPLEAAMLPISFGVVRSVTRMISSPACALLMTSLPVKRQFAASDTWGCRNSFNDEPFRRTRAENRKKLFFQSGLIESRNGLSFVNNAFADQVNRHSQCGVIGSLGGSGLKHVQRIVLDREFDILHVTELKLDLSCHGIKLPV